MRFKILSGHVQKISSSVNREKAHVTILTPPLLTHDDDQDHYGNQLVSSIHGLRVTVLCTSQLPASQA